MRARMAYCGPRGIPLSTFLNWPVDDQAAAIAWMVEDRLRCQSCGTAEWEWEADLGAYTADAHVCMGCQLRGVEEKKYKQASEHMPGLQIRLVPSGSN